MRSIVLYSALKKYILAKWPTQYITRGFIDYEHDNDLGIYVKDIAPLKGYMEGDKYQGRVARVQLIFQATQSDEDFYTNRQFMNSLENYLLKLQNVLIATENSYTINVDGDIIRIDEPTAADKGLLIGISNTNLITSIADLGKSPDGRPMFSINLAITYFIGGKNNG